MARKTLGIILLLCCLGSYCIAQKPIEALLDSLTQIMEKNKIPGAMISIVTADSIIYAGGLGVTNIDTKEAVTADHLFRLGSVSKSFIGMAALQLSEQNRLDLNQSILEIDPKIPLQNDWAETTPITTAHLLEHTAGFDDLHGHAIYNKTDSVAPSCAQLSQTHVNSLYTRWQPGTRMAYANPGYVVAGQIIETVTQQPYHQYLKTAILNPLGMTQSGFYFKRPKNKLMVEGHIRQGGNVSTIDFTHTQGGPAGELCSNAKEMAKFLQFMLNKGNQNTQQIISPQGFGRLENAQSTLAAKAGLPGGYGLGNSNAWRKGYPFHGHNGGIDGFVSDYTYSREANMGVAVAINRGARIRELVREIINYYVEEDKSRAANRLTAPIPQSTIDTYEGFYFFKNPRMEIRRFLTDLVDGIDLDFEEDKVIVRDPINNIRDTLYHAGNNQFYSKNEGIPFAMFLQSPEGKTALWLANDYAEKGSKTWGVIKTLLFIFSIFSAILFFLYGLVSLLIQIFSKKRKLKFSLLGLWLTALSFIVMIGGFIYSAEMVEAGEVYHIGSIILFVSGILFLLLAFTSFLQSFQLSDGGKFYKFYYRLTAFCLFGLALYLFVYDFIGFKMWAY